LNWRQRKNCRGGNPGGAGLRFAKSEPGPFCSHIDILEISMSEYLEEPDGKIRADFALRVGRLFCEYERRGQATPESEQFDATMTIVLLQSLLTTCDELRKSLHGSGQFPNKLVDVPSLWGLRSDMVVRNSFPQEITHDHVLTRMRNALSHPAYGDVKAQYPVTGFRNLNENGKIVGFSFVNSPDVKTEGQVNSYANEKAGQPDLSKIQRELDKSGAGSQLELRQNPRGKYEIFLGENPYVRVFQIDVPLNALKKLLSELSNFLAQATRKRWDGMSVEKLVA
jgi:hypothetical protein